MLGIDWRAMCVRSHLELLDGLSAAGAQRGGRGRRRGPRRMRHLAAPAGSLPQQLQPRMAQLLIRSGPADGACMTGSRRLCRASQQVTTGLAAARG